MPLSKPIRGLEIAPSKGSAFAIETPRDLPKLHQLLCCVGARGSGKTVAVTNFKLANHTFAHLSLIHI